VWGVREEAAAQRVCGCQGGKESEKIREKIEESERKSKNQRENRGEVWSYIAV
jgi:hypothetical protein